MLKSLQVKNFVLIDSLEIEFPAGLIIITGQTGAGKSILLGALSLVLGAKADASMVGKNADNCMVEAEFQVEKDAEIRSVLENNDLDWNGGNLIIRRVLAASGRSRCFVNDEPVSVGVLNELSSRLVDIHSQHETLMLSNRKFQLSILDHYAGNETLLSECSDSYRRLSDLRSRHSELVAKLKKLENDRDFNQHQFDKIDSAKLREGELEELEAEQIQLANAEEIKSGLFSVANMFTSSEEQNIDSLLKEAVKILSRLSKFVPRTSELAERLESSRLELVDIVEEISDIEENTEVSAERLQEVEERMSLIYDLLKKFSCESIADLNAYKDSLAAMLFDSAHLEDELNEVSSLIKAEETNLDKLCNELHKRRLKSAPAFANDIQNSIRSLELENSVFDIALSDAEVSPSGRDSVTFLFSSTGKNPVDVSKCASGGEMSRIMLCLKAMMAKYTNMPSMIFDEIDTGVSGSVADKMGTMICSMGKDMQVFAITHLPQVAAKGEAHYLVTKQISGEEAKTTIHKLDYPERVDELARMLSGSRISPEAIANAKALLDS